MTTPAHSRVGLLAYQAERSSAVSPKLAPTPRFQPGADGEAYPTRASLAVPQRLKACRMETSQEVRRTEVGGFRPGVSPEVRRLGRAALGLAGQEAYPTRAWHRLLLLFLLLAPPLAAQFELQVVDAGGARIAPSTYDLGSTSTGSTLTARFRLRNTTNASATASVITVGGVGFSLAAPALPVMVEPQVALDFAVTFRSDNLGSYSAVLRAENVTILLTAAVAPSLTYRVEDTPLGAVLDFGRVVRGSTVRRRFTIVNETPVLLTVPAISLSGADFAFTGLPPSGAVLGPQQSATFAIDFSPSATGSRLAILVLGSDRSAILTGVGLDPPLPRPSISVDLKQVGSAQQGALIITFDQPAATSGTGTAVLDFRGSADPTVAFAAGGRTVTFPVLPGDTSVALQFQTGTTAGTLVFSVRLGDAIDTLPVQIPGVPAVLTQVQGTRSAGGLVVQVTGWDNTHSVSQLAFTFFDAAGNAITPGAIRVDSSADFERYYANSDVGGAFALRAAFPVSGDATQVASFEISVGDSIGTARSARTPIQ
jgi:hypothetical protein